MQEHVTDLYVQRAKRRRLSLARRLQADGDREARPPAAAGHDRGRSRRRAGRLVAGAASAVGADGRVIALDILEMAPLRDVTFMRGDFRETRCSSAGAGAGGAAGGPCGFAIWPPISAVSAWSIRRGAVDLAELALEFALKLLKPGGYLLVKVFQGAGFDEFRSELRRAFRCSRRCASPRLPAAASSEIYLLAGKVAQVCTGTAAARPHRAGQSGNGFRIDRTGDSAARRGEERL